MTVAVVWRKMIGMEVYSEPENKRAYGLLLVAAVATAALAAVPFLPLSLPIGTGDAAFDEAAALLHALYLRALLLLPLLAVVPALWARCAWRVHPAALVLLAGAAFATAYYFTQSATEALFLLLLVAPLGGLLYAMQRGGFSNFKITFYGSVLLLGGLFFLLCGTALLQQGDAFVPFRRFVKAAQTVIAPLTQAFAEDTPIGSFDLIFRELFNNAETVFVGALYWPAALCALLNVLFSHLLNRKGGASMQPLPPFSHWQVEGTYLLGVLAFCAVSMVLSLARVHFGSALLQVAYMLFLLPMSLAGLCTLRRWTVNRRWLFVLFCVFAALFYSAAAMMLSTIGMLGFMQEAAKKRMQGGKP